MGRGVLWKGKYYVIPQAASSVDSSELSRANFGSDNRLAILSEMVGFVPPKIPYKVSNAAHAMELIHPNSTDARMAVSMAFDPAPGSEVPGASEVYLVPVNPATQSALTLDDAAVADVVTLTSYLYGVPANQVKVKVEAGTNDGVKLSITFGDEDEVYDDIYHESFSILYTGAATTATMTIDLSAGTLVTACAATPADDLDLTLADYGTMSALIVAIEAAGVYTVVTLTDSPNDDVPTQLDTVTAQDIKTAAYTHTASLQAVVDTVNTKSGFVSAARVANAGTLPDAVDWTFLAGAINGVTANSDWQDAFDELKAWDIQLLLPVTSTPSLHAMGDTHCSYMSGPDGKSERRQFVGGVLNTWTSAATRAASVAALVAEAKVLNSDRTMHAGLGCTLYNEAGVQTLYPAYMTAAIYAGMAAGGSPVFPLTRNYLRVLGLEADLRKAETHTLLEAGLAVPIPDTVHGAGFVVSRQVTTWLQNSDLYRVEFSVGRGVDYIARQVRERHEDLVGKPGTEALDATIVNLTNGVLQSAKREELIRSYDPAQTQLRVEGTVRYVDYSAVPIMPVNWIFSTFHLKPLSLTIQLTV